MVETSIKAIRDLSLLAENMLEVGRYIGLSDEECSHPKAGEWITEELKNYDTASLLRIQMNLKKRIATDTAKNPLQVITDTLMGKVDNKDS